MPQPPQIVAFPANQPQPVTLHNPVPVLPVDIQKSIPLNVVPIEKAAGGRVLKVNEYAVVTYMQDIGATPNNPGGANCGAVVTPMLQVYCGPGETIAPQWEVRMPGHDPHGNDFWAVWKVWGGVVFGLKKV